MTGCDDCRLAEMTPAQRMRESMVQAVIQICQFAFRPRPTLTSRMLAGYSRMFRAALGQPEPTWYDRHREAWAQSGDLLELERMLRHVR